MHDNKIALLIKKVQEGKSSQNEELLLLQRANDVAIFFRAFVKEIKIENLKVSISKK